MPFCERSCGEKYFRREDGSAGKMLDYQASNDQSAADLAEEDEDKEGSGNELHPLRGQAIDMGRLDELVAVGADGMSGVIIGHDEDDVRPRGLGLQRWSEQIRCCTCNSGFSVDRSERSMAERAGDPLVITHVQSRPYFAMSSSDSGVFSHVWYVGEIDGSLVRVPVNGSFAAAPFGVIRSA